MIRFYDLFRGGKWVEQTTDLSKAVEYCFARGCEVKVMEIPGGML